MSSLTGRGARSVGGGHWNCEVQHHRESPVKGADNNNRERPAPEGSGGSRGARPGDPHLSMCQRAAGTGSCSSLPGSGSGSGSVGDRIRTTLLFGGGTLCRGTSRAESAGFGRSERKVAHCEKCSATLVALKKQALTLAVHHHFSCKDSNDLSVFLHDNLRVHSRSTYESRDREWDQGQCTACGTNLHQLKHEAVHLALNRGQSLAKPPFEPSTLRTASLLGLNETRAGDRARKEPDVAVHQQHGRTHHPQSPRTPQRTPQTLRRKGVKLPHQDMDRWVEEQQHLVACKSVSNADAVTGYPYHKASSDTNLARPNVGTLEKGSKIPHISKVVNIANTAAMSFLARAAEKLSLTLRKKGQASDPAPAHLSTCFRDVIQKNPLPIPSCLLQAATRIRDSPNVGKVKVVLRVSPALSGGRGQPSVLQIDPSKKRITVPEPFSHIQASRDGRHFLKTFNFDAAYPQESSQAELCAGVLADVIRCVLSGSDGCVLGLGCADVGSWSSMVGSDESAQTLGIIPCAVSWLYSTIERRREKTWTDLTVSVSAIELCCGEEDTLRDLLGEVAPSVTSAQDSPRPRVKLQEDPVYGIQLRNHNRVKAPTAERAASLLDVAIAARRHSDFITYLSHTSIMFFTLHIQPPRTESSTIGKGLRGPTKLTLIDVCSGMRSMSKNKPPHSELGPIVVSLLSGHKAPPNKGSKLAMLLREALGHINCHTTVIAEVADSFAHLQETLSTVQLAARIRRTQKRTKQTTSCSPSGRSLTREKRGPQSFSLRAFHSTDEVDADVHPLRLRGELDEHSSSEQSYDTVIQIGSDVFSDSKATQRLVQPKFVPIIPSLHPNKSDLDDPEFTALLQELLRIPQLQAEKKKEETVLGNAEMLKAELKPPERDCLKCETFAELQERLGCIDGSEMIMEVLKSSSKILPVANVTTKSQPKKEGGKQTVTKHLKGPQALLNQGLGCKQTSEGEKSADGAVPGDSFQREDSGLYDCEECSAASSSEELLNQAVTLNMNCCSGIPNTGTLKLVHKLPAQSCDMVPQSTAVTNQPSGKQECPETAEWFKAGKRASPVGKSSTISPTSSCSSSSPPSSAAQTDVLPSCSTEDGKEMKATITVTVQQPLDLKGQDELVFSMVEEVTISGGLNRARTGGNIICLRDNLHSQGHIEGCASSQPIRIISNLSDESTAPGSSGTSEGSVATETHTEKLQHQCRKEGGFIPSFINPMLMNTDVDSDVEGSKEKETQSEAAPKRSDLRCPEHRKLNEKRFEAFASETNAKKFNVVCDSAFSKVLCNPVVSEASAFCNESAVDKMNGKRAERRHLRDKEHVYSSSNTNGSTEGGKCVGNVPRGIGASPGCQETACKTGSLPRVWQNASHQDCHMTGNHREPRAVTTSTPSSPALTLERRQGRHTSPQYPSLHFSSPVKYGPEQTQEACSSSRQGTGSAFEAPNVRIKHEDMRSQSPTENSGRFFGVRLEQLACRTNSLGRAPRDFPTLYRGSSNTSMSSKGSSKGSNEGVRKGGYKDTNEGHCTLPRANRSPRKSRYSDQSHHYSSQTSLAQSSKHAHHKLSAVGKLKMTTPKSRRLSAPSVKNTSLSHRSLRQSSSRSASLSPDSKAVTFEGPSSFVSSSPTPRSIQSISRTPSQSSTCSSTKSAIQGYVNGRISDLLKDRSSSPTSVEVDEFAHLPSPYSRVTAPRSPEHLSGHASDTTSVLSGDLPPAMVKTSLYFSNRNSTVSSGYDSLLRDSGTYSNRDSVSDRSNSALSLTRSSRSSRRKGGTGSHQRRPSEDGATSLRRSTSGARSRWVDRGIPEAYEIKVYDIDKVQRTQKRAGPGTLQRQTQVFGSSSVEDLRGPEERHGAGAGQTPHYAGSRHMEPRI